MIAAILPPRRNARAAVHATRPISLVPVANNALIRHQLRALRAAGIRELIIPSDDPDLHEYFRRHYSEGVSVSFQPRLPREPVIVLDSDTLPGCELRSFLEYHARSAAPRTIAATATFRQPVGMCALSPEAAGQFDPSLLTETVVTGNSANTEIFALADDTVRIRTVNDYLAATRVVLAKLQHDSRGLRRVGEGVWTDGIVFVEPDARITGDVFLGQNCSVASGATIVGPAVLGEGTMICRNAWVENSVIWAGAAVGSNARVTDSLVTACFTIGPGAVFSRCVGIDRACVGSLPLETVSHAVQYSPRGLGAGAPR